MNDCIFCRIVEGKTPSEKIYEDDNYVVFLDIRPINPGHALLIPKVHSDNLLVMSKKDLDGLLEVASRVGRAIMEATGCDGLNFSSNIGRSAGQAVFHAHFHLIPRQSGDGLASWPHREIAADEAKKIGQKIREKLA